MGCTPLIFLFYFFAVSLSIACSDLGVNLPECPLLGKLATVLNVFRLGIIVLTVE